MRYKLIIRPTVRKALNKIKGRDYEAIDKRLNSLTEFPRPIDAVRLKDVPLWRVRVRDCRIVYHIDEDAKKVIVLKIARRNEQTYKNL